MEGRRNPSPARQIRHIRLDPNKIPPPRGGGDAASSRPASDRDARALRLDGAPTPLAESARSSIMDDEPNGGRPEAR